MLVVLASLGDVVAIVTMVVVEVTAIMVVDGEILVVTVSSTFWMPNMFHVMIQ